MINTRKSGQRGHFRNDWLDSNHSFSFGEYYDPAHMGVSVLRVINEDRVAPAGGFPTHPHRDMEIVSYVLDGELEHKDSMGNGSVIRPGDVQRMSAGTGVTHSEFNPSAERPSHFLQIWLLPERRSLAPDYEQKHFSGDEKQDRLKLVVSPDGRDGSVSVNSPASIFAANLSAGRSVTHEIGPGRLAYLQVARGSVSLDGQSLEAGDGATVSAQPSVVISGDSDAEVLLFDLPEAA